MFNGRRGVRAKRALQGSGKGNVKKSDSLTTFVTPTQLADTVSAINRVGNVASGTWLASVIGLTYGGTGTALANGSAGQVLKSDGDGTVSWGTAGGSDSVWNIVTLGSDAENANGTLNFIASDGDAANIAINTDNRLTFNGGAGGYIFDGAINGTVGKFDDDLRVDDIRPFHAGPLLLRTLSANNNIILDPNDDGGGNCVVGVTGDTDTLSVIGIIKVDGNKTTDNLLELVNDDDGVAAAADSGMVVSKLGGIYSSVLNGGAVNLTADASGNIIRDPAGDIRFKQNIYGINDPLDKLVNLRGVRFTYKESEKMPGIHYGMVAQEVEKVVPELVTEGSDGRKNVRYTNMVALLVEAVKDQQLQIYELQKQVNELRCKK